MKSRFVGEVNDLILLRPIKRSVFIEAREWFDKTGGNSYFSARIWVDGEHVITMPFQYGYGDHYLHEATKVLISVGYLPESLGGYKGHAALWHYAMDLGFDLYKTITPAKKSEMFKEAK